MSTPSLSVIIPAYNAEHYISRCLNSITVQPMRDFEVILIDDGSTDATRQVAEDFAANDKRFVVVHTENKGVSAARNLGISIARGEWVTFIDADDYIEPQYFPDAFDPAIDIYLHNWHYHEEPVLEDEWIAPQLFPDSHSFRMILQQNIHKNIFIAVLGKIVKRSLLEKHAIQFDTFFHYGEDTLFFLDVLSHCRTALILNSNYVYDKTTGNTKKYVYSPDKSLSYIEHFAHKYRQLDLIAPQLPVMVFRNLQGATDFSQFNKLNWLFSPQVISLKRLIYPSMRFPEKCKFLLSRYLSPIVTYVANHNHHSGIQC